MEKPITNSMGNRLLWADLLFCSLWLLAVLGGRGNWNTPVHFVAIFTVVLRLSFSFAMARGEKRAWLPLALMVAFGTLTASVHQIMGINIPAHPRHYWRWRMHLTLEELLKEKELNQTIRELIEESDRE